jgi:hypothetical protein
MTRYADNEYSRSPMTPRVKEELMQTRTAQARKALAGFLALQPLSYNQIMEALKAAPKNKESTFEQGEFLAGQTETKRILGR